MENEVLIDLDFVIPLRYDFMFKAVFCSTDHLLLEYLLTDFLSDKLSQEDIHDKITFLNQELEIYNKNEKKVRVDIVCEIDKLILNIEMQNIFNEFYKERNLIYGSKIHGTQIKEGAKTIEDIGKFIQLIFVNYPCNNKKIVENFYFRGDDGQVLSYTNRVIMVDMVKARNKCYNMDRQALWCRMIISKSYREISSIMKKLEIDSKVQEQYLKKIRILSSNTKNFEDLLNLSEQEVIAINQLHELEKKESLIEEKVNELSEKDNQLTEKDNQLTEKDNQLTEKDNEISKKDEQLAKYEKEIKELKAKLARK